jgi:hypothetical protein
MIAMSLALAGAALQTGAAPMQIRFKETAVIRSKSIRFDEVADLTPLPPDVRAKAERLVLLSQARIRGAVPHAALAARARSLMPLLRPWLEGRYAGYLQVNAGWQPSLQIVGQGIEQGRIADGEVVALSLSTGSFTIERQGVALQSALDGAHFFAKTSDGVVVALCCGGHP